MRDLVREELWDLVLGFSGFQWDLVWGLSGIWCRIWCGNSAEFSAGFRKCVI